MQACTHRSPMSIATRRRSTARRRGISADAAREVGPLLDEYVRVRQPTFTGARRVLAKNALPPPFRNHAEQCDESTQWRAWIDAGRIWFLTGRLVSEPGSCADEPALRILFFDADGALTAGAVWVRTGPREWLLRRILDVRAH